MTVPTGALADLAGKVAVVTGGASGIGRALSERLAREGMRLVLADVEADVLAATARDLRAFTADVLDVPTDVRSADSVGALADRVLDRFGPPTIVCANAGVAHRRGRIWEVSDSDWEWVLDVNLLGVARTVRAFVPPMVAAGQPAQILITSSAAGLFGGPGGIYDISKHAVTRFGEALWHDLTDAQSGIDVSLLCPGRVATRLITSARTRLGDAEVSDEDREKRRQREISFGESGMSPDAVASIAFEAMRDGRFYIHTHEWPLPEIERRTRAILDGAPPPRRSAP